MNELAATGDWDFANMYGGRRMMPNCVPNDTSVAHLIKNHTPEKEPMTPAPFRSLRFGSLLRSSSMPFAASCMNRVPTRSACSSEWVIQMIALRALV